MLEITTQEKWLIVKLNRPEVRNAFNSQLIKELTHVFKTEAKNKKIIGCQLTGADPVFCAGADLQWMKSMVDYSLAENKKDSKNLYSMFEALWQFPKPVITYVQGAAFGGALGLVACSDYVIADPKTQFCFSEVKLGIVPAVISAFVLQKIPTGMVQPLMMSGRVFDSAEALRIGMIHQIGEADELLDLRKTFESSSPNAPALTKKLIRSVSGGSMAKAKNLTTDLISKVRISPEGQEGLRSFLEKRKPSWSQS
jgi:methylglutaconyl-CoA hydratase